MLCNLPLAGSCFLPPPRREEFLDNIFRIAKTYHLRGVTLDDGIRRDVAVHDGAGLNHGTSADALGGRLNDGIVSDRDSMANLQATGFVGVDCANPSPGL